MSAVQNSYSAGFTPAAQPQTEVAPAAPVEQGNPNSVYVGNLQWAVDDQTLANHMAQAGHVVSATVLTYGDGRSAGCGVVQYSTPAEAGQAINTLTNTAINDRPIFVREDRPGPNPNAGGRGRGRGGLNGGMGRGAGGNNATGGGNTFTPDPSRDVGRVIWVGNLPFLVSWMDLKDHFKTIGNVIRADVALEPSGRSRGWGLVLMGTVEEANNACAALNDQPLAGRPLNVRLYNFN